jgi:sodium pump decarboxylase gamma subunit
MNSLFLQGLLITAIGMGLVFILLILLWGLMAQMANIKFKGDGQEPEEKAQEVIDTPVEAIKEDSSLRARAAAVAVAAALALQKTAGRLAPPSGAASSSWQTALRSSQFNQNALITNRKTRGSSR